MNFAEKVVEDQSKMFLPNYLYYPKCRSNNKIVVVAFNFVHSKTWCFDFLPELMANYKIESKIIWSNFPFPELFKFGEWSNCWHFYARHRCFDSDSVCNSNFEYDARKYIDCLRLVSRAIVGIQLRKVNLML